MPFLFKILAVHKPTEILLPWHAECRHPHPAEKSHFIGLLTLGPSVVLMTGHLSRGALASATPACMAPRACVTGEVHLGSYRLGTPLVPPSPNSH